MQEHIEVFDRNHFPNPAQLEALCDLFKENIPAFDETSVDENIGILDAHGTPDAFRTLLETKTMLLVCKAHDEVVATLEWDPRDKSDVVLAYITWLIVDEQSRGQKLSSKLHAHFEQHCIPSVIEATQKTVLQGLSVHVKNPALKIYRKWGYSEKGAPQWNDGRRLFMIKEPTAAIART